jgi:hypothetical protein
LPFFGFGQIQALFSETRQDEFVDFGYCFEHKVVILGKGIKKDCLGVDSLF